MNPPNSADTGYEVARSTAMLDVAGVIYPDALAVKTRCLDVKRKLQATYGGRIEPSRWITRSLPARKLILSSWYAHTRYADRKTEVAAALYQLEHANDE